MLNDSNQATYHFDDGISMPNGLNPYRLRAGMSDQKIHKNLSHGVLVGLSVTSKLANYLRDMHRIDTLPFVVPGLFIGYDVCDEWLTSGLMNCGLSEQKQNLLREKFSYQLNNQGLFDDFHVAEDFSKDISQDIPEHVQFLPVGIFILGIKKSLRAG